MLIKGPPKARQGPLCHAAPPPNVQPATAPAGDDEPKGQGMHGMSCMCVRHCCQIILTLDAHRKWYMYVLEQLPAIRCQRFSTQSCPLSKNHTLELIEGNTTNEAIAIISNLWTHDRQPFKSPISGRTFDRQLDASNTCRFPLPMHWLHAVPSDVIYRR